MELSIFISEYHYNVNHVLITYSTGERAVTVYSKMAFEWRVCFRVQIFFGFFPIISPQLSGQITYSPQSRFLYHNGGVITLWGAIMGKTPKKIWFLKLAPSLKCHFWGYCNCSLPSGICNNYVVNILLIFANKNGQFHLLLRYSKLV